MSAEKTLLLKNREVHFNCRPLNVVIQIQSQWYQQLAGCLPAVCTKWDDSPTTLFGVVLLKLNAWQGSLHVSGGIFTAIIAPWF